MPDTNFNHPEIDIELLPCHNNTLPEVADITTQVAQYFWEAMKLFISLKKAGQLWSTSIVAHRAFVGCVSHRQDTKTISSYDLWNQNTLPQEFYFNENENHKRTIPYTSLQIERDGSISSWPPKYYIKFHHEQDLPIGYFDDETRTYNAIGDADFQKRWTVLIQKMLQTGFVSFLQWNSKSLTSEYVRDLLWRNVPRLGDEMILDMQKALLQIRQ